MMMSYMVKTLVKLQEIKISAFKDTTTPHSAPNLGDSWVIHNDQASSETRSNKLLMTAVA